MKNLERAIFQQTESNDFSLERGAINYSVNFDSGSFWYKNETMEKPKKISLSTMVADLTFGIKYSLPDTASPEAKENFKKYQEEAQKYNEQLKLHWKMAKVAGDNTLHLASKKAYRAIERRLKNEVEGSFLHLSEPDSLGLIGEKIVESILKKIVIEANILLEVLRANPIEDVEGKIDLILRREQKRRGIEMQSNEEVKDIGFQLIVAGPKNQNIAQKENQLKRVLKEYSERFNDIILLRIPPTKIKEAFFNWKKDGYPPGGPSRYLTEYERRYIAQMALQPFESKQNFITDEELKRIKEVAMYALI